MKAVKLFERWAASGGRGRKSAARMKSWSGEVEKGLGDGTSLALAGEEARATGMMGMMVLLMFLGGVTRDLMAAEGSEAGVIRIAQVQHPGRVDFQKEILPILKNNCLACHNRTKAKAALVLETPQTILKGGESGPAVVAGHSVESLLVKAASHQGDTRMPPKDNKVNASDLTPEELGLIVRWIEEGATGEVRATDAVHWQALPPGLNAIYGVAISGDGQVAACSRGNRVVLYGLSTGEELGSLSDPSCGGSAQRDVVHAVAFSAADDLIATAGYQGIKLWRRGTIRPKHEFVSISGKAFLAEAVTPDREWLVTGDALGRVLIWSLRDGTQHRVWDAHERAVTVVRLTASGSRLLTGSADGMVRAWDFKSGQRIGEGSSTNAVQSAVWEGDQRVLTGGTDGVIRVWEVPDKTGSKLVLVRQWKGHEGTVTCLEAIPQKNDHLLSGGADGAVIEWATAKGTVVRKWGHGSAVEALAVRPDGKRYASAGIDKKIKLWNAADGKMAAEMSGEHGTAQALAGADRELKFAEAELGYWKRQETESEAQTKKEQETLKKAAETKKAADGVYAEKSKLAKAAKDAASAAEKALSEHKAALEKAAAATQKTAEAARDMAAKAKKAVDELKAGAGNSRETVDRALVELAAKSFESGRAQGELDSLKKANLEPQLAEKSKAAAKQSAEAEKELKRVEVAKLNGDNDYELALRTVAQMSNALAAAKSGVVKFETMRAGLQARQAEAKKAVAAAESPVRTLAFSADNQLLASGGDDGMIHLWSGETGSSFETIRAGRARVLGLGFDGDDAVVSADASGRAAVWPVKAEWHLERTLGSEDGPSPIVDRVNALAFSPDGKTLASGSGEPSRSGQIEIWDTGTGAMKKAWNDVHSDSVLALAFSPEGSLLASGAADKFVKVVEVSSGKVRRTFEGHLHHVLSVTWTADGRTLASGSADGAIKIWDFEKGETKKTMAGSAKEISSLRFVGISHELVAGCGDGKARLFQEDGKEVRVFSGATDFLYAAAATMDGRWVVAGGQDGVLRVWNGTSGALVKEFAPAGMSEQGGRVLVENRVKGK